MAVQAVDGWWVYACNSLEVGHYETEAAAIAAAQGFVFPDYPVIVLPGTLYKHVEDPEGE